MQASADSQFEAHRPLLFHIAYRMLGAVSDAEDIVQEAWIRWQSRAGGPANEAVRAPKAYLSQIVTRLAIDRLREARRTRETYPGPWLPEPLLTDPAPTAGDAAARLETLHMGFLVLLERLRPVERAVFVLREAFDYEYAQIAELVGKSEANCRQILARARKRLAAQRPERAPDVDLRDAAASTTLGAEPARRDALVAAFMTALATGDVAVLERMLAADAIYYSDGGGKVTAARNPIYGAERVIRFLLGLLGKLAGASFEPRPVYVNGEPGVAIFVDGRLHGVHAVEIADGRIQAVRGVLNPDKLAHLTALERWP